MRTGAGRLLVPFVLLAFGPAAVAQENPDRAAEVRGHQACIMLIAYVDEGVDNSKQMAIWRRECDRSTLRELACARLRQGNISTEGMRCDGG